MQFAGFVGPSYTLDSLNVNAQRCVNLYPQMNEVVGKNSEVGSLVRTPNLTKIGTLGTGPNRGNFTTSNKRSFAVSGSELYEITSIAAPVLIGTLQTSSGKCGIADNGVQMLIVDGLKGYVFTFATNAFLTISDPDFPVATHCCFIDQYLIVNDKNTRRFYLSALSDATDWDGLDFASKEGAPDNVEALLADHKELLLVGDQTSEIWFDSGDTSFPFARMQGAFMEFGIAAPESLVKLDNAAFMLAQDRNGQGMVYRVGGYQGQRVSTFAVEKAINSVADISGATAWTYQMGGHTFYVLNVPGLKSSWVLDVSSSMWHERDSWSDGGFQRCRAENHCMVGGIHVVGDYQNGNLYQLTKPTVDISDGSDRQVALEVSRDGGHTFGSEHLRSFGKIGEYKPRVMWNKLGCARDFVFRISGSDPNSDNGNPVRWMRTFPHLSQEMRRVFCAEFRLDMELGTGSVALISAFLDVTAGAH